MIIGIGSDLSDIRRVAETLEAGLEHLAVYLANPQRSDAMNPAGAHWRRALILDRLGRTRDAIAAIEEALRLQPDFPEAQAVLDRLRDA